MTRTRWRSHPLTVAGLFGPTYRMTVRERWCRCCKGGSTFFSPPCQGGVGGGF